jgi:hypothetical protein
MRTASGIEPAAKPSEQLLFLFSSNIRPLYEQDILDVLAAPSGVPYRFRYDGAYVSAAAKDNWTRPHETDVLVLFSLQQEAEYQRAVFFPIRAGRVSAVRQVGNYFFVEFLIGQYVSLPPAPQHERRPNRFDWAKPVGAFTDYLEKTVDTPYKSWASLGLNILRPSSEFIDVSATGAVLFDRTTQYLCHTDSFKDARFFRFFSLTAEGAQDRPIPVDPATKMFHLTAGSTYILRLFHSQPTDVRQPYRFIMHVDGESLKVIGREWFDISSRYDIVEIPIRALYPRNDAIRDTVFIISPSENIKGAGLRLSFKINPGDSMA